jgi:hypothetical protein
LGSAWLSTTSAPEASGRATVAARATQVRRRKRGKRRTRSALHRRGDSTRRDGRLEKAQEDESTRARLGGEAHRRRRRRVVAIALRRNQERAGCRLGGRTLGGRTLTVDAGLLGLAHLRAPRRVGRPRRASAVVGVLCLAEAQGCVRRPTSRPREGGGLWRGVAGAKARDGWTGRVDGARWWGTVNAPRSGCRAPGRSQPGGSSSCSCTPARCTEQRAARVAARRRSAAGGEASRTPLGASPGRGRQHRPSSAQPPGPARARDGAAVPCPHAAAWAARRRRRQPS